MKELTLRLADEITDFIAKDAKEIGLTSEEHIKNIVGVYVQHEKRCAACSHSGSGTIIGLNLGDIMRQLGDGVSAHLKSFLKSKASAGDLSCSNCTMKLTEQDVDNGKCGVCDKPLEDILKEGP